MSEVNWTSESAWNYISKDVFQDQDLLPFFAYSVGCANIDDFMYLQRDDFEATFDVSSLDDDGRSIKTTQTLSRVLIGKLQRAQKWYDSQNVRSYETWGELNIETLNKFRERTEAPSSYVGGLTPLPVTLTPNPVTPAAPFADFPKSETSVTTFAKSIKRSADDYPAFLEGKHWYNWQRKVKIKAATHGCENVLDRNYVPDLPSTPLFREHQKFLFDVLMDKVQTQRGKQIVRVYESTLDAQKVWAMLCDEYGSGVHAHISGATAEAELMALKCDPNWKSCVKFLNTWQLKLMDLEEIRDYISIPDSQKRLWLESALAPNKDMTTAITNSQNNQVMVQIYMDQFIPAGSAYPPKLNDLPFDKYFSFLLDHAKRIDETKNLNTKTTRSVNKSEKDKPKSTAKPQPTVLEDSKIDYSVE